MSPAAKKRCYQTAPLTVTGPGVGEHRPCPARGLALPPWPVLHSPPEPPVTSRYLADSSPQVSTSTFLLLPQLCQLTGCKATQTSHLFWGAPMKNVILLLKRSEEKALQPVAKRYLRQLKMLAVKAEESSRDNTHWGRV